MPHRYWVVVLGISALFALPALAQDAGSLDGGLAEDDAGEPTDAGEPADDGGVVEDDAGPVDCTPRCDGEILRFCDADRPVSLDCSESGATCGVLTPEWGADCLLPEGAACDPSYADGVSRCQGASTSGPSSCCVEGVCTVLTENTDTCRAFRPGAPDRPGTGGAVDSGLDAVSCLGCDSIPLLSLAPLLVGLRLRRRRKG